MKLAAVGIGGFVAGTALGVLGVFVVLGRWIKGHRHSSRR